MMLLDSVKYRLLLAPFLLLQLCGTTPCMVNGAVEIKNTIEKHLGIHDGGELVGAARRLRYLMS
jgi:hypothetical protein